MKEKFKLFKESGLFMTVVLLLCSLFGIYDAGAMTADAVVLPEAGKVATNQINTRQFVEENDDDLLENDIERMVVKINQGAHPLTQFAFYAERVKATSMVQELRLVDVLPDNSTLAAAYVEPSSGNGVETLTISMSNNDNDIFSAKETIIFPEVGGYEEDGLGLSGQYFVAYILRKTDEGKLVIKAINGKKIGTTENSIPALAAGTKVLRAGRAHNELDMQTPPYAAIPTKEKQHLQIFKCQVEESTLEKIAKKEVDWHISDVERMAVDDMKKGMSKSYLLGTKGKIHDADRREVFLTGGVYWQAKRKFLYAANAEGRFTYEELVHLTEMAFTGGNGSKKKYFTVGSGLMTQLSLIKYADNYKLANSTHVKYGVTFKEISTNFGTLYVVHDETFDHAGMRDNGFVFDPTLLRKHAIENMSAFDLDLRKSGDRNVDARTITDISGLVLQNRLAHIRVEKYA
jgi:hypothetical protein